MRSTHTDGALFDYSRIPRSSSTTSLDRSESPRVNKNCAALSPSISPPPIGAKETRCRTPPNEVGIESPRRTMVHSLNITVIAITSLMRSCVTRRNYGCVASRDSEIGNPESQWIPYAPRYQVSVRLVVFSSIRIAPSPSGDATRLPLCLPLLPPRCSFRDSSNSCPRAFDNASFSDWRLYKIFPPR